MNPVTYARYFSTYSSTALAKQLGVTRQYLQRVEQGLYDKPSPKLLKWTAETLNKHLDKTVNQQIVTQLYKEWQWQERESTKLSKALRPLEVNEYDKILQASYRENHVLRYYKIFSQWRGDYWNTGHAFCVDMKLHPAPVAEYEEGSMQTMPSQLKKVLKELQLIGEGFDTSAR